MPTKNNPQKNDVARRLAGIKKLFVAAETKSAAKAFGSSDQKGVPGVPEVDVFEDITTFENVANGAEAAITQAINAFGGYSEAQYDGDIKGAAAEVHADVRALTNVALGLSPPSRTFYNKVLGGLVEIEHVAAPPSDGAPVPYPPLRVSLEEIEKHDVLVSRSQAANGSNGSHVGNGGVARLPREVARKVDVLLHASLGDLWLKYLHHMGEESPERFSIRTEAESLASALTKAFGPLAVGAIADAIGDMKTQLTSSSRRAWTGEPVKDWAYLQSAFDALFAIVRES
jgi:hypothetical protein